jgi:hypothetical protein
MRTSFVVGFAVLLAVLVPTAATGESASVPASGNAGGSGIDIVHVEMLGTGSGAGDVNVYGTLRCTLPGGPITLDVTVQQPSTGTMALSVTIATYTCPAPGKTIKWVQTVTGSPWIVDDQVKVIAAATGGTTATTIEHKVLRWGLHLSID